MEEPTNPSLGYATVLAGRAVEAATSSAAASLGMSKAAMNLLYEIAMHAPVSASTLARLLVVRPSAITPLTNSLQAANLIESVRSEHDKRVRCWVLTRSGSDALSAAFGAVGPDVDAVFASLTSREADQLTRLLGKVVQPWLAARLD